MKSQSQKREYYLAWKRSQDAEDRGDYDHLVHSEEIIEWISRGWLVSELTEFANDRNEVRQRLGLTKVEPRSDDPFEW